MAKSKSRIKKIIKGFLPKKILKKALIAFHFVQAVIANIFVSRGSARGMRVVGVTGTNGKTTTVTLVANMLREAGFSVATYSTTHYQIGDEYEPNQTTTTMASVYHIHRFYRRAKKAKVDIVVQEVTSQALEQFRVLGITFEVAVMTNLTYEHQDYHGGMKSYAAAKARLFKHKPRFIVLNADDEWYSYFNTFEAGEQKISYGTVVEAGARIRNAKNTIRGSKFTLDVDGSTSLSLQSHLLGEYNIHNIAAAATVGSLLGLDTAKIESGILKLDRVDGRLEHVDMGQNFAVFTDYAHTPDGLKQVLRSLKDVTKGRLILVQSSMDGRDPAKRIMLGEVSGLLCDEIIVTDEEAFELPAEVMRQDIIRGTQNVHTKATVHDIADRQKAIDTAINLATKDDTVLIVPFGHQTSMTVYGKTIHWDDREAAGKALEKDKKSRPKNYK